MKKKITTNIINTPTSKPATGQSLRLVLLLFSFQSFFIPIFTFNNLILLFLEAQKDTITKGINQVTLLTAKLLDTQKSEQNITTLFNTRR